MKWENELEKVWREVVICMSIYRSLQPGIQNSKFKFKIQIKDKISDKVLNWFPTNFWIDSRQSSDLIPDKIQIQNLKFKIQISKFMCICGTSIYITYIFDGTTIYITYIFDVNLEVNIKVPQYNFKEFFCILLFGINILLLLILFKLCFYVRRTILLVTLNLHTNF